MSVVAVAGVRHVVNRKLALLILCGANLALVLVVAGSFTTLSDIVAPLTGHLIGIGLAASLALLLRRMSVLVIGIMATFAVHAWLGLAACCEVPSSSALAPPSLSKASTSAPSDLSIVALNAWHNHSDLGRLESYLVRAAADLVVLSEFGPSKRTLLENIKQSYPFQVHCAEEWACSLALISRTPFESAGTARIGIGKPAFVWARLAGGVTVIGTHLHRPSRDPWLHERQTAALTKFISSIPGPVILAGDLNTTPWSRTYRNLRRATGLVPASILRPTWPAWPIAFPQVALDHIFASPELAITATGTGPAVGSDHLPIWATMQRRQFFNRGSAPIRRIASGLAPAELHFSTKLLADLGSKHHGARDLSR